MKFVFWAISIIVILGGCLWLYRYIKRTEQSNTDYFALLRQLAAHPQDDSIRASVWNEGRKFYKNRLTGIDRSVEIDIENALAGGTFPEDNSR